MKGKVIIKIGAAFVAAFLLVNGLCFGLSRLPKAFMRSANVTEMVWNPGTTMINSTEGIGVYSIDKHGFLNTSTPEEHESYILVLGASHTEGKEVPEGQRYTDLLNEYLESANRDCFVYNMGMDAHFFDKLIAGFSAAVQEFPEAERIVLEVSELNFSKEELEKALEERPYVENQQASSLQENSSRVENIKGLVKECVPFFNIAKKQFATKKVDLSSAFGLNKWTDLFAKEKEAETLTEAEYYEAFRRMTDLLRGSFEKEIIILYHPSLELTYDGELRCDYPDNFDAFRTACMESGLTFCDVGDAYISAWQEEYTVPRGFHNTEMGYGHINKYGHRIIADELYTYMQEGIE